MARTALIAGNWKMNGLGPAGAGLDGVALATALAAKLRAAPGVRAELLVCPSATLIARVARVLGGSAIALGGQDCHAEPKGAHTGDVSAEMLKDAGCRYVIVGHSERRAEHGESDAQVHAKAAAAQRAGLVAIVCVGETEAERIAGRAGEVVRRQLAGSLPPGSRAANTVVAYEPVWAIGTGRTPSAADIAEIHGVVRAAVAGRVADVSALRILYGGSVKAQNAREILGIANVDGALVGGASLEADEFWAIAEAAP